MTDQYIGKRSGTNLYLKDHLAPIAGLKRSIAVNMRVQIGQIHVGHGLKLGYDLEIAIGHYIEKRVEIDP